MASCNDNVAGPGAKGELGAPTLAEGGAGFALYSSSLVSILRMVNPSAKSKLRTVRVYKRAYIPPPPLYRVGKYALQGLIAWKDIIRSLEAQYTPSYWELAYATKTYASQAALVVFRQVFLSIVQILIQRPVTNALTKTSLPPSPLNQDSLGVPQIIVTPPANDNSASLNVVPTPQDAAFGNQLTVPDPEFKVINCRTHEDPFSDASQAEEYRSDSLSCFGDGPGDAEKCDEVIKCVSWEDEDEDEEVAAICLGSTWSG